MRISDLSSDVCSSDLVIHRQGYPKTHLKLTVRVLIQRFFLDSRFRVPQTRRKPRKIAPNSEFWCRVARSEEHTSELQSLMRISYAVFCLTNKITIPHLPLFLYLLFYLLSLLLSYF